ncbi:hypothetical protein XENOCAPTIV_021590, partial [Xenoophorus captivus]
LSPTGGNTSVISPEAKIGAGRSYRSPAEEVKRKEIWLSNRKLVLVHNIMADQGIKSYRLGMTYFADMVFEEKSSKLLHFTVASFIGGDQAACIDLKTGKLVSLSEQQLVDCSGDYGNMGCMGGLMDDAFKYIQANGGIDTEDSYPYEAECRYNPDAVGATCTGYVDVKQGDEDALKEAVATIGPVSPTYFYKQKLYCLCFCSWGVGWGDNGYIMMTRNKDNQCGIATAASYPLV